LGRSEKNSGTVAKWMLSDHGVCSAITRPSNGKRSSQKGAMRGRPLSSSPTDSPKSPSPAPKVRLPFALTNTSVCRAPWNGKLNPRGTATLSSSARSRSVPRYDWMVST
jgi:hypothetical protein